MGELRSAPGPRAGPGLGLGGYGIPGGARGSLQALLAHPQPAERRAGRAAGREAASAISRRMPAAASHRLPLTAPFPSHRSSPPHVSFCREVPRPPHRSEAAQPPPGPEMARQAVQEGASGHGAEGQPLRGRFPRQGHRPGESVGAPPVWAARPKAPGMHPAKDGEKKDLGWFFSLPQEL